MTALETSPTPQPSPNTRMIGTVESEMKLSVNVKNISFCIFLCYPGVQVSFCILNIGISGDKVSFDIELVHVIVDSIISKYRWNTMHA